MVNAFDDEVVSLAEGILDGSADRIDGLWRLGGCISNASFFTADQFGVLIAVFDELERVPRLSERSLWNESAYARERARGDEVVARHAIDIERALSLALARAGHQP